MTYMLTKKTPKSLIFLDIDGPMIPFGSDKWLRGPDGNMRSRYIIPKEEFEYSSRFADQSKELIRALCEETGAGIVTNTTHNSGCGNRPGAYHIFDMFKRNEMEDLLVDAPYRTPYYSDEATFTSTDRATAIWLWLQKHPQYAETPWIAIDDWTEDYIRWNAQQVKPRMNIIPVGSDTSVTPSTISMAKRALSDPEYVPDIIKEYERNFVREQG